jgi:hypothetical protein
VKVSITPPDCGKYTDLTEDVQAAEKLKKALWGKNLEDVLDETSYGGTTWKYMSKQTINSLELRKLGYSEPDGFLIRPEYDVTLGSKILNREDTIRQQCHGVVVFGQPGIGVLFLLIIE